VAATAFADGAALGDDVPGRVRAVLGAFSRFDVTFRRFGRFDAQPPVLYLDPEPGGLFVGMIAALEREFPAFPSFGGIHETVIPHLTIAQTDDATAMHAAKDDVAPHLPIRTRATAVTVMEHLAAGWRPRERIPLSP
jgi:2'-5' RNA ligase